MSNAMALPGVPTREDCASCPDAGDRCALHQIMLDRHMIQTQQALTHDGGHGSLRADEQSHMSKTVAREMNRLKTQEGQMINVRPDPLTLHARRYSCSVLWSQYLLFTGSEENEFQRKETTRPY